jgi:hypothetical protein
MKPGQGYTWGMIMKSLGGNSSMTERLITDANVCGYIQEIKPIDGINRSFRINQ